MTLNIAKNKILEITIKIGNFHCQWYLFEKKKERIYLRILILLNIFTFIYLAPMKNERIKRLSFRFRADILFHLIGVACVTRIIRRHGKRGKQ